MNSKNKTKTRFKVPESEAGHFNILYADGRYHNFHSNEWNPKELREYRDRNGKLQEIESITVLSDKGSFCVETGYYIGAFGRHKNCVNKTNIKNSYIINHYFNGSVESWRKEINKNETINL